MVHRAVLSKLRPQRMLVYRPSLRLVYTKFKLCGQFLDESFEFFNTFRILETSVPISSDGNRGRSSRWRLQFFGNLYCLGIDVGTRGHWGQAPPRFCNKQRSALFIHKNASFFLRKRCPRSDVPPSLRYFLRPCAWKQFWASYQKICNKNFMEIAVSFDDT